jgi:hypothetical protein
MGAFTDAEIADFQADLATMLPDSAVVQRATRIADGGGGWTQTWATVATVVCRLTRIAARASSSGVFRTAAERLNDDTTHMVAFAAGLDVRLQDRVMIGTTTYEVLAIRSGGAWELARHVEVKEAVG